MCGIVCVANRKGDCTRTAANVETSLSLIAHRGPDGLAVWENNNSSQSVILGHCRLSIIDLTGGQQPLHNVDHTLSCVVNGELYGYQEIREALESKGHSFQTHSDSEIALHLYAEYGMDFLTHMRGEFALVLYDAVKNRLVAARDRFGVKPLYYTFLPGGSCYLASEIKALESLCTAPFEWDVDSIVRSGVFASQDQTVFKGIKKIPPAHYLVLDLENNTSLVPDAESDSHNKCDPKLFDGSYSARRIERYWSVEFPDRTVLDKRSEDEMIQGVRQRLCSAVYDRLTSSDVPVAVALSGGIDSSAVLGIAASLLKDDGVRAQSPSTEDKKNQCAPSGLHAFTISFPGNGDYDEAGIAQRTAFRCGADYHQLDVRESQLANAFAEAVRHAEAPVLDLNVVAKYLFSEYVSGAGFKVLLTGEGADEHFAGYHFFRADFLRAVDETVDPSLRWSETLRTQWISELEAAGYWNWSGYPMSYELSACRQSLGGISTPGQLSALWGIRKDLFTSCALQSIRPINGDNAYSIFANTISEDEKDKMRSLWHPLHSALNVQQKTMLPNLLCCHLGDRSEMAHSVEGRPPFLCHRLTEYVNGLPPSMKLRLPTEKWILREAVRPYVSDEIYGRTKQPFCAPPNSSVGPFADLIRLKITAEAVSRLGWMEWSTVETVLTEFNTQGTSVSRNCLCIVLSFLVLADCFHVQPFTK